MKRENQLGKTTPLPSSHSSKVCTDIAHGGARTVAFLSALLVIPKAPIRQVLFLSVGKDSSLGCLGALHLLKRGRLAIGVAVDQREAIIKRRPSISTAGSSLAGKLYTI